MAVSEKKLGVVQELKQELHSLRSNFESIVEKYILNAKAQIDEILEKLDEKKLAEENQPLPKKKNLEKVLSMVQKLKLKPEKGRMKDIRKIQAVLDEFTSVLS
jgi:hypothetical protein